MNKDATIIFVHSIFIHDELYFRTENAQFRNAR